MTTSEYIYELLDNHHLDLLTGRCVDGMGRPTDCRWLAREPRPGEAARAEQHRHHVAEIIAAAVPRRLSVEHVRGTLPMPRTGDEQ